MSETIELPTKAEAEQWINKLKSRGVPAELECGRCDDPTETTVLPEERDNRTQKTICRDCTESFLRK